MTVVWKLEVGPVTTEGRKGNSGQEKGVPEKRKRVRLPGRQQMEDAEQGRIVGNSGVKAQGRAGQRQPEHQKGTSSALYP